MIKKELRRATQRKDWKTVQELENILKTKDERRKLQAETKAIENNQKIAEMNAIKMSVDVEKTMFDRQISLITLFSVVLTAFWSFIKELPIIKQFFK